MHKKQLERALYYLNNRHRLSMADVPHYMEALRLAKEYQFVCEHGRWYLPQEDAECADPKERSA
jgi:hypothetical protein